MFDKYGRGVISWSELNGVMKLLGFPNFSVGLLSQCRIENNPANSIGLDNKDLYKLLHSDEFHTALDYTFNKHNSIYNIRVIKKVISVLVSGMLTLDDLREARLSFVLYEGESSNGVVLDEKYLLNALRVTGKVIAPKKLQEWLKQLSPDVPGRMQLYEYFDLIKLCDNKEGLKRLVANQMTSIQKDGNGLYELADSSFLLTPDQKLLRKMDDEYDLIVNSLQTQQAISKEKSGKDATNNNKREKSLRATKIETLLHSYTTIKQEILDTNPNRLTRTGRFHKRASTADPGNRNELNTSRTDPGIYAWHGRHTEKINDLLNVPKPEKSPLDSLIPMLDQRTDSLTNFSSRAHKGEKRLRMKSSSTISISSSMSELNSSI